MKSLDTTILSFGTCNLHVVHNAFRAGVNALSFSIDSFVVDVNLFQAFCCQKSRLQTHAGIYRGYFPLYTETLLHKMGYTKKDMCSGIGTTPKAGWILFEIPPLDINFQIDSERHRTIYKNQRSLGK